MTFVSLICQWGVLMNEVVEQTEQYNDRRALMNKRELQFSNEWMERILTKYPEVEKFEYNVFGRFIQGYRYTEQEVSERFETFYEWYKNVDLGKFSVNDFPDFQSKKFIQYVKTLDTGYIFLLIKMSRFNFKKEQADDLIKFTGCFLLNIMAKGDPIKDRYLMVVDMSDFSLMGIDKDVVKQLIPIFGNYFPDILHRMFIINAGYVLRVFWKGIQNFLHPVTLQKIRMVGSDQKEIQNLMAEEMVMNELPQEYGGNMEIIL